MFELATDFQQAIKAMSTDRPPLRILRLLEEALRRDDTSSPDIQRLCFRACGTCVGGTTVRRRRPARTILPNAGRLSDGGNDLAGKLHKLHSGPDREREGVSRIHLAASLATTASAIGFGTSGRPPRHRHSVTSVAYYSRQEANRQQVGGYHSSDMGPNQWRGNRGPARTKTTMSSALRSPRRPPGCQRTASERRL